MGRSGLNRRLPESETGVLPTELLPNAASPTGGEPDGYVCSWLDRLASNQQPAPSEGDALPIELRPIANIMVAPPGLEPGRTWHPDLNRACLPVPPRGQWYRERESNPHATSDIGSLGQRVFHSAISVFTFLGTRGRIRTFKIAGLSRARIPDSATRASVGGRGIEPLCVNAAGLQPAVTTR